MNLGDLADLLRKYASTGATVVVVVAAPATGGAVPEPEVRLVAPGDASALTCVLEEHGPDDAGAQGLDHLGADGRDPAAEEGDMADESAARDDADTCADDRAPETDDDGAQSSAGSSGTSRSDARSTEDERAGAPRVARATASSGAQADGQTAAERLGWGEPVREDDFGGGTDAWNVYDGPGHAGNGRRSPSAISVADGILTITGDSSGTTGGMAWLPGQKHGRWEGRVKAPASDESYNALLLLWPDAEDFPVGGEIDFMEMMDHTRQQTDIFVHYGADNSQVNGNVRVDATQWHNWAVEWTPNEIVAYVDGREWYRTTDTSIFPPGPMHLCIQLDWFPTGGTPKESVMYVDWVRQYALDT